MLLAGLDVARPAAQEQLLVLGEEVGVDSLQPVFGEQPAGIAKRAMETAKREGFDAVILDTAGRLAIDHELMMELAVGGSRAKFGGKEARPSSPFATALTCSIESVRTPGAKLALTTFPCSRVKRHRHN